MNIIKQYNLPSYVKGKSFAEASKLIQKKFGDRTDPESIQTRDEMLGRLRDAQEATKEAQQAEQPQHQMPDGSMMDGATHGEPNQYFAGGFMSMAKAGQGAAAAGKAASAAAKAAKVAKVAGKVTDGIASSGGEGPAVDPMGLVSMFTGSKVDQSGDTLPDVPSVGSSVANKAMAGAATGASFGPWGAAIGGVVGAGAGLITGLSDKNRAQEATMSYDMKQSKKAEINQGDDDDVVGQEMAAAGGQNQMFDGGSINGGPGPGMIAQDGSPLSNYLNQMRMPEVKSINQLGDSIGRDAITKDNRRRLPHVKSVDHLGGANDIPWDAHNYKGPGSFSEMTEPIQKAPPIEREDGYDVTVGGSLDGQGDETTDPDKKKKAPLASYLRYAPVLSNAAQLLSMKKPEEERTSRSYARYNEQMVDERAIQNATAEGNASNRAAIIANSQGSGAAARANLVGNSAGTTRALGAAYSQAAEQNRQEKRNAQAYNDKVDMYNMQKDDQDAVTNMQNLEAHRNTKSNLMAGLANSAAGIGKEELMKQYPELMGMDYGPMGEYFAKLKREKAEKKANRKNKKE